MRIEKEGQNTSILKILNILFITTSILSSTLSIYIYIYERALSSTGRRLIIKVGNWICYKAFTQPSLAILTFQA